MCTKPLLKHRALKKQGYQNKRFALQIIKLPIKQNLFINLALFRNV